MPFIVSRSDAPSKMYARQTVDNDICWEPNRANATRFTEDEADIVVHEFSKYSQTELDIEGAKPIEPAAEAA